jgi:hypothetical protein
VIEHQRVIVRRLRSRSRSRAAPVVYALDLVCVVVLEDRDGLAGLAKKLGTSVK